LKEYSIGFKGLKDGNHEFDFHINSEFFSLLESSFCEDGDLEVKINLAKSQQMLILDFDIFGTISTVCDNCLELVDIPLDCETKIYVKFGDEYDEPTEEIIVLPHDEHEFNVAHILYELIVTAMPIRHVHSLDENDEPTCDSEMVKKLSQYLVDQEPSEEESTGNEDPRWNELKKLMDKHK
jgi:uncharacterized protein